MPFFTPHTPKPTRSHAPVFAGLDDPFNFPTSKMRYNARSTSPVSTADSGYGSIDDDAPLSPKAHVLPPNRRRLQKDSRGQWTACAYAYHTEHSVATRESQPGPRVPPSPASSRPEPKRSFTDICNAIDAPRSETWLSRRIYIRALARRDACEGATQLQREMAPVLRRAPASPSLSLSLTMSGTERGRARTASTALRSSLATGRAASAACRLELRSPRDRSPTPLGIPTSSERQPAPTPLRIRVGSRTPSGESVLRGWVSDDEFEGAGEMDGEGEGEGEACGECVGSGDDAGSVDGGGCEDVDAMSISSMESVVGGEDGGILARTALVARAQRVKVRSPGLKKTVDGVGV